MREALTSKMYQHATALAGPTAKVLHTLPEAIAKGRVCLIKKSTTIIVLTIKN